MRTLKTCYQVSVLIGEGLGHYLNDWIMNTSIRRNNGVFEAESRLWSVLVRLVDATNTHMGTFRACYVAIALYVVGMILIGVGFQHHLSIASFIIGWGMTEVATMVNTVAVCKYPPSVIATNSTTLLQMRTSTIVSRDSRHVSQAPRERCVVSC